MMAEVSIKMWEMRKFARGCVEIQKQISIWVCEWKIWLGHKL